MQGRASFSVWVRAYRLSKEMGECIYGVSKS